MRRLKEAIEFISDQKTEKVDSLPSFETSRGIIYEIEESKSNEYTHNIYKFPTKFIPEVPRWALNRFSKGNDFAVMDPFCGSGTTMVESSLLGKFSAGIDINPFCRLLTKVKTTPMNSEQFVESKILSEKIMKSLKDKKSAPGKEMRSLPELPSIEHWYDEATINDLATIRNHILEFIDNNGSADVADFFKICLACILKKVSLADEQSPKPYVSRRVKKRPGSVLNEFGRTYLNAIHSLKMLSQKVSRSFCRVIPNGSAGNLQLAKVLLNEENIEGFDLLVTSPPYINAYDLVRTFKLELFWLDLITPKEVRRLKEEHVGTENIPADLYRKNPPRSSHTQLTEIIENIYEIDQRRAYVVWKFFADMKKNLEQAFDLLLPAGHYVIVIGNSTIRGNEIPTSRILSDIGIETGFAEAERLSYMIKNHYLRIPRGGKGGKINIDNICVLVKP